MAKRSVKKARQRDSNAPRSAATPDTAPSRRQFWLGVLVAAAILVPIGIVGIVLAASGDDEPTDAQATEQAAVDKSIESEAEKLRRQTQVRDKDQVQDLTERMRATADVLDPIIAAMHKKALASAATVTGWRNAVRKENEYFADTVSGETGTNVARGGFASSLDALNEAVETYALALNDPGQRAVLLERAAQQRDLAVRTWSFAATQLDAINIATGFGHQHVYLGGSEEAGGVGADPEPEGSGAGGE
jgi:hypothetical protein